MAVDIARAIVQPQVQNTGPRIVPATVIAVVQPPAQKQAAKVVPAAVHAIVQPRVNHAAQNVERNLALAHVQRHVRNLVTNLVQNHALAHVQPLAQNLVQSHAVSQDNTQKLYTVMELILVEHIQIVQAVPARKHHLVHANTVHVRVVHANTVHVLPVAQNPVVHGHVVRAVISILYMVHVHAEPKPVAHGAVMVHAVVMARAVDMVRVRPLAQKPVVHGRAIHGRVVHAAIMAVVLPLAQKPVVHGRAVHGHAVHAAIMAVVLPLVPQHAIHGHVVHGHGVHVMSVDLAIPVVAPQHVAIGVIGVPVAIMAPAVNMVRVRPLAQKPVVIGVHGHMVHGVHANWMAVHTSSVIPDITKKTVPVSQIAAHLNHVRRIFRDTPAHTTNVPRTSPKNVQNHVRSRVLAMRRHHVPPTQHVHTTRHINTPEPSTMENHVMPPPAHARSVHSPVPRAITKTVPAPHV